MNLLHAIAAAGWLAAGLAPGAVTAQSLAIELQNPSTGPAVAHMRIVIDRGRIEPGRVTLHAQNQSKHMVHEVVIARDEGADELPLNANRDRVLEARVKPLGEIANLAPGATGSLTLTLEPGAYILFCNLPGHYPDGMSAKFVVEP